MPHNSALWRDHALDAAVDSLSLFGDVFGTYPYSTYNLVEAYGFYSGMEYPCQVQISEGIKERHPDDAEFWLELTIAHEGAHQWWSQIVGNDQIDYGHLDEGLASWSTDYYFDYYNPNWNYFDDYWATDEVRTYYQNNGQPNRVNQSAYEFVGTDLSFRFTAYTKAPMLFQKLRSTIGHNNFIAGLKHFYDNNKFSIATLPFLQQSFEERLGKSLDWFFLPWFDNLYLPNYNFKNVTYDSNQGTMRLTIIDSNENLNNYVYSQQIPLMVMDIRSFGVLYSDQVWINGTTTLNLNLSGKITPGEINLVYGSEVLVQLQSASIAIKTYRDSTWLDELERPDSKWLPFGKDDWLEWTYRVYYTDSRNQISSLDQTGILHCDISQIKRLRETLEVETEWAWSPTHDLLTQFTGSFTSYLDGESHTYPYHISLISLFVGPNFQFTDEWLDSLSLYINTLSYGIENEGRSLNIQYSDGLDTITIIADYNSDGILSNLEVEFDPLYPTDSEGPELHGKLILNLRSGSFKNYRPVSASLVELALIPFTGIVIVAYVVYFLKKLKTN